MFFCTTDIMFAKWECEKCGFTTPWSYADLVDRGNPKCPECDDDMMCLPNEGHLKL